MPRSLLRLLPDDRLREPDDEDLERLRLTDEPDELRLRERPERTFESDRLLPERDRTLRERLPELRTLRKLLELEMVRFIRFQKPFVDFCRLGVLIFRDLRSIRSLLA